MKFLVNKRLATRMSIITTAVTLVGMLLLWVIVSTNAASVVKNDITNQMTDAVESRAAIINEYVASAEEYMSAFALGSEVRGFSEKLSGFHPVSASANEPGHHEVARYQQHDPLHVLPHF